MLELPYTENSQVYTVNNSGQKKGGNPEAKLQFSNVLILCEKQLRLQKESNYKAVCNCLAVTGMVFDHI